MTNWENKHFILLDCLHRDADEISDRSPPPTKLQTLLRFITTVIISAAVFCCCFKNYPLGQREHEKCYWIDPWLQHPGSIPEFRSHEYVLSSGLRSAGTAVNQTEPALPSRNLKSKARAKLQSSTKGFLQRLIPRNKSQQHGLSSCDHTSLSTLTSSPCVLP